MARDVFVRARTLERCALRFGEPAADARILAIDLIGGRPHQAPQTAAAMAPALARKGVDLPGAATGFQHSERGRLQPGIGDAATVGAYEAAIEKAAAWSEVEREIEDAVATCHYAPAIGLVPRARIDAYIQAFIEVTCLAESMRGADGKLDAVAHARASAESFRKAGTDARGFSELGLALSAFDNVTAEIARARAARCPDPRAAALHQGSSGTFDGKIAGDLQGVVEIVASAGDAKATARVRRGKGKPEQTFSLLGVLHGGRAHLQGGQASDWLRLEAPADSRNQGSWEASIGFRRLTGRWTWQRRPDPEPAADSAAAPAPTDPGAAAAPPAPLDPKAPVAPAAPPAEAPVLAPAAAPGAATVAPVAPAPPPPPAADTPPLPGKTAPSVAPPARPAKPAADPAARR